MVVLVEIVYSQLALALVVEMALMMVVLPLAVVMAVQVLGLVLVLEVVLMMVCPVFGGGDGDAGDGVGDGDTGDGCPVRVALLAGASVDDLAGASAGVSGTSAYGLSLGATPMGTSGVS